MFGWNKNPMEKRRFVDAKTGEPKEQFVQSSTGEVIGHAGTPGEAAHLAEESAQEFKEAA